jgi:hypothetical protein
MLFEKTFQNFKIFQFYLRTFNLMQSTTIRQFLDIKSDKNNFYTFETVITFQIYL